MYSEKNYRCHWVYPPLLMSPDVVPDGKKVGGTREKREACGGESEVQTKCLHTLPAPGAYLGGMSKCLNWKHKVLCPSCHTNSHKGTQTHT